MSYFAWKTFVPQSWKSLSTLHVLLPEPLTLLSYVYRGSAPKVSSAKKKRKETQSKSGVLGDDVRCGCRSTSAQALNSSVFLEFQYLFLYLASHSIDVETLKKGIWDHVMAYFCYLIKCSVIHCWVRAIGDKEQFKTRPDKGLLLMSQLLTRSISTAGLLSNPINNFAFRFKMYLEIFPVLKSAHASFTFIENNNLENVLQKSAEI